MAEEQKSEQPLSDEMKSMAIVRFGIEIGRVKDEHRMLILVTSGFIELLVNALIDVHCKNHKKINASNRDYPLSVKLVLLHEMKVLSDGDFSNLNWLRMIRNRAAHDAFFEVTTGELSQLKPEYSDPLTLHHLCLMIFGTFWNGHLEVFVPKFMKSELGDKAGQ